MTAISITGDVTFAPDRITFGNGKSLPLAPAGSVPGFKGDDGKQVNATLFSVTAPDDPVLLSDNGCAVAKRPGRQPSLSPGLASGASAVIPISAPWPHSPAVPGRQEQGGRVFAERTITNQGEPLSPPANRHRARAPTVGVVRLRCLIIR